MRNFFICYFLMLLPRCLASYFIRSKNWFQINYIHKFLAYVRSVLYLPSFALKSLAFVKWTGSQDFGRTAKVQTGLHFVILTTRHFHRLLILTFLLMKLAIQQRYKFYWVKANILLVLIWVQTVCKGYQQMTKVAACSKYKERIIICYFWLFHQLICWRHFRQPKQHFSMETFNQNQQAFRCLSKPKKT